MKVSLRRGTAAAVAMLLGTGVSVLAAAAPAGADQWRGDTQPQHVVLTATGTGTTATLSRQNIRPGAVTFTVRNPTTASFDATIFSINKGGSITKVLADIAADVNGPPPAAAAATRALDVEVNGVGGVFVSAGQSAQATVKLKGDRRYYIVNANTDSLLTTVNPDGAWVRSDDPDASATIVLGGGGMDAFRAPKWLPASGTVRVVNRGKDIHFVDFYPVAPGTTDAAIQAEFNQILAGQQPTSDPAGLTNPNAIIVGEDVLSPGNSAKLTYRLHPGTYVLLCFVADAVTGAPHAFMGMHLVVHLG